MKKILLALVSVIAAVGTLAQSNTKGLITFKTLSGTTVNAKVSLLDRDGNAYDPGVPWANGSGPAGSAGWYAQLLYSSTQDGSYAPLMGTKTGAAGPVVEPFVAKSGYVNGGDWALDGVAQGQAGWFKVGAFYSADPSTYGWAQASADPLGVYGASAAISAIPGGNDLTPPAVAAKLAGLQAWSVAVPEPSVLALGVLGLGAFLLRRRS